jgi:hypothetical protein
MLAYCILGRLYEVDFLRGILFRPDEPWENNLSNFAHCSNKKRECAILSGWFG